MANLSLTQLLLSKETGEADTIYLRQPRQGLWEEYTWAKVMQQARKVASFLQSKGLKKGDTVSIYSKNCAEWFITDFGITLAGMINVPLFANQHPESLEYILEHAQVKLVFVGKLDQHVQARANLPEKMPTVNFDYHTDLKTDHSWKDVLGVSPLEEIVVANAKDTYTIIYTSGTSGNPKGTVYDHEHIANYLALFSKDLMRFTTLEHHHFVSYLPLAHVYERTAVQLASVSVSSDVSFVESLESFAHNLQEIRPTIFTAVPRIWGVFKQKIEAKLPPQKMNFLLKIPFVSTLIKKKIRKQLGLDRCDNCACGASHLPLNILDFFEKIGIIIQEGYGQTENLAYATLNKRDERKKGYVGTARLGVELKLGEQDELLVKSDCLMQSYYKDAQATQEAFEDGWLKTGDIADIDAHGNVKILGRLSEVFKNQKGEFIKPAPIEKDFASNRYVEQLCLVGQGLPNNVMVVAVSPSVSKKQKEKISNSLKATLKKVNTNLVNYEKMSHVIVSAMEWTPENGMLTPTLKIKRREVLAKYMDDIQKAIAHHDAIYWVEPAKA